jgi:hypothetical protein
MWNLVSYFLRDEHKVRIFRNEVLATFVPKNVEEEYGGNYIIRGFISSTFHQILSE